jgi:hypothetical protein
MTIKFYEQKVCGNKLRYIADKKEAKKYREIIGDVTVTDKMFDWLKSLGVEMELIKVDKPNK